jgi:hypothetical protein
MTFSLNENEKFSFIAIDGCYSDIESEVQLSDGTWVLPKMPADVDEQWIRWVGEIHGRRLSKADLVILRCMESEKPGILDGEHNELFQQVLDIFTTMQLSSVVYYEDASALQGSFHRGGEFDIRQVAHLDHFNFTNKSPRYPVTIERLEEAARMAKIWRELVKLSEADGRYARFVRGVLILRDGLQEYYGQNRIREFTRAIEALIKPDVGGTTKQFKKRPQSFGVKGNAFERILYESYEMRCDVEHVHAADRFFEKDLSRGSD